MYSLKVTDEFLFNLRETAMEAGYTFHDSQSSGVLNATPYSYEMKQTRTLDYLLGLDASEHEYGLVQASIEETRGNVLRFLGVNKHGRKDTSTFSHSFLAIGMLDHVVLGQEDGKPELIMSGRNRIAALGLLADAFGVDPSVVNLQVCMKPYKPEYILVANSARSMNPAEKKGLNLGSRGVTDAESALLAYQNKSIKSGEFLDAIVLAVANEAEFTASSQLVLVKYLKSCLSELPKIMSVGNEYRALLKQRPAAILPIVQMFAQVADKAAEAVAVGNVARSIPVMRNAAFNEVTRDLHSLIHEEYSEILAQKAKVTEKRNTPAPREECAKPVAKRTRRTAKKN